MDKKYFLISTAVLLIVVFSFASADILSYNKSICGTMHNVCPHKSFLPWYIYLGYALSFFIIFIAFYEKKAHNSCNCNTKTKKDISKFNLSNDEEIIMNILLAEKAIFQKDLIKKSSFSKVKVTRLLDKLEEKGLIERKRKGMSNLVVLK